MSLWGSGAVLVLYFAFCWMSTIPFGDELQQFPRALHTLNPGWLAEDLFVGSPQGDHWVFFRILAAFFWLAGPIGGSVLARVAVWCLMSAAIVSLGRALRLGLPAIMAGVAIFVAYDQCRLGGESIVGEAIARHLAYPLVLFAIAGWINGRFLLAGALLGTAISVHVLVGAWAATSIITLMLLDERVRTSRLLCLGPAAVCLLFALPGFISIMPLIQTSELSRSVLADEIFIYFRHSHHLHPGSWPIGDYIQFVLIFAGFLVFAHALPQSPQRIRLRQFVWLMNIITVIAIGIGLLFRDAFFFKLHPYRFAPPLTTLMAALLLAQLLFSFRHASVRWAAAFIIVVAAAWNSPRGAYHLYKDVFTRSENEKNRLAALQWIKDSAPSGAVVLADPAWSDVQWQSRRISAASFKLIPFEPTRIVEWYQRLTKIVVDPPWTRPGQFMLDWYSHAYNALPREEVLRIGSELHADVIITGTPCDRSAQLVYSNEHFCIHSVPDPAPSQNYVIVRYDDYSPISPYEGPPRNIETEKRLFALAQKHHGKLAVNVIPYPIADNARPPLDPGQAAASWLAAAEDPWVTLLRNSVQQGVVEPALHGFEHRRTNQAGHRPGEFRSTPPQWQYQTLRLGRDALGTALSRPIRVFVPPWNAWDQGTVSAMEQLDFEVLSSDQHHAEHVSPRIRFIPQCTADPADALAVMRSENRPDGSILVLILHPFDFEKDREKGEAYFQSVEKVFDFARSSPSWLSIGFSDLPTENPDDSIVRFTSAVELHRVHEMLIDLRATSLSGPMTTALIRPVHWYQDNLWRVRLPIVCLLALPALGLAFITRWAAVRIGRSRIPAALGLLLAAFGFLYLADGAWQIAARGYAVRGLRRFAISLAAGAVIGLASATVGRRGNWKRRNSEANSLDHERYDQRAAVPV